MLDPLYKGAILHEFDGSYVKAKEEIIKLGSRYDVTDNTATAAVNTQPEERTVEENLTPAQRLLLKHQMRCPSVEMVAAVTSQPNNVRKELDEYLMNEGDDTQEILS